MHVIILPNAYYYDELQNLPNVLWNVNLMTRNLNHDICIYHSAHVQILSASTGSRALCTNEHVPIAISESQLRQVIVDV